MISWIKDKASLINDKYKQVENKYRAIEAKIEKVIPKKSHELSAETINQVLVYNQKQQKKKEQEDRLSDLYKETQLDIERDTEVRVQARQWIKEKRYEEAIEILDEEIAIRKDMLSSYELYKLKAECLYKNGNSDEAWTIYSDLLTNFMKTGQDGMYAGVYKEQAKQLEFEKRYRNALVFYVGARLFSDRYNLLFNPFAESTIDWNWNNDKKFIQLAEKVKKIKNQDIDWNALKSYLVDVYKDLDTSAKNNPNIFGELFASTKNIVDGMAGIK